MMLRPVIGVLVLVWRGGDWRPCFLKKRIPKYILALKSRFRSAYFNRPVSQSGTQVEVSGREVVNLSHCLTIHLRSPGNGLQGRQSRRPLSLSLSSGRDDLSGCRMIQAFSKAVGQPQLCPTVPCASVCAL